MLWKGYSYKRSLSDNQHDHGVGGKGCEGKLEPISQSAIINPPHNMAEQ